MQTNGGTPDVTIESLHARNGAERVKVDIFAAVGVRTTMTPSVYVVTFYTNVNWEGCSSMSLSIHALDAV